MMVAQGNPQRKRPASQPDEETRVALEKARAEAGAALARAKDEERARLKTEEALTDAQKALTAARAEVEQECRAWLKIEQARAEAQGALAQARKAMGDEAENTEPSPTALGEEGAERRVTFIVRLTVDQRGQPRRSEIEHAQSGKKETFPGLDVQRLAAFMEACISLPNHPATDDPSSEDRGVVVTTNPSSGNLPA